jgi:hypothetical protein
MLSINISHLSEATINLLVDEARMEENCLYHNKCFQFLKVYILGDNHILIDVNKDALIAGLETHNLPQDLHAIIAEAFSLGCNVLRLNDNNQLCQKLAIYN